jgi:hypothetical protein
MFLKILRTKVLDYLKKIKWYLKIGFGNKKSKWRKISFEHARSLRK